MNADQGPGDGPERAAVEACGSKIAACDAYFKPTFMNCVGPNGSILNPSTFLLIG